MSCVILARPPVLWTHFPYISETPNLLTRTLLELLQSNSYNSRYLADKLEIGNSAAMAYGLKRNPLLRARSSLASIAHKFDDMVRLGFVGAQVTRHRSIYISRLYCPRDECDGLPQGFETWAFSCTTLGRQSTASGRSPGAALLVITIS